MKRNKDTITTIEIDGDTLLGLDNDKISKCGRCKVGHDIYSGTFLDSEYNEDDDDSTGYVCEHCLTDEDDEYEE